MQITSRLTMAAHMVCAIDYFGDTRPVTSTFLAGSIGTSPVMVRTIMGMLKQAGIISSSRGKSGITLARPLEQITLLDLWRAVDQSDADSLFHFHENPCPQCPVGGNIHAALDNRLKAAQQALEDQLARTTLADVEKDVRLLAAS
ncbi:MAG: Rrf2 family transcriptional regulator [Coriobacteriaceae bacterium]|jgi:Rrf2 family protein|nr:Rrf2 family transcriptional regulator [Olsenella sp.]RRF89524.1 MAG: Rrf2 family transcriptional regulator [Coriobacteriaceae bacterium]